MNITRFHAHTDGFGQPIGGVLIQIDTDGDVSETHARQHHRSLWWQIREAAEDVFHGPDRHGDDGEILPRTYAIASSGKVHHVTTVAELAAVTRRERALWGVAWREDPKAVV